MSFVIVVRNSKDLENFFYLFLFVLFVICFICYFICYCFFFLCLFFFFVFFFFFFFSRSKDLESKCYCLPFFLLAICNGKNLHRIEHTKWIKQGQDCHKVIANKTVRIYIFIYHHFFFSLWFARFLQSLKHEVQKCRILKNVSPCLL